MEFLKNNLRGIVISLLVAGVIISIASLSSDNTDEPNEAETSQSDDSQQQETTESTEPSDETEATGSETEGSPEEQSATVENDDEGYTSTTVDGDNQTVVVRRIISNYLSSSEAELSAEQMLYVETNLVGDLGRNDFVAVGEEISLSNDTIQQRVDEARNLSEAAIMRWSAYL